jgi:hypothetical protein
MKCEVTFTPGRTSTKTLGFFHFGGYETTGEGETRDDCIAAARVKRDEAGFSDCDGPVKTQQLHTWAITVRGKKDRRRREIYYVDAVSEGAAIERLSNKGSAYAFAGSIIGSRRSSAIVKVVPLT